MGPIKLGRVGAPNMTKSNNILNYYATPVSAENSDASLAADYSNISYKTLRRAALAAKYPHMPCTPPPGGVDAEHMYRPLTGVE